MRTAVPKKGKKLRVVVLKGGPSHEHEVSLKSAENVGRHLDREKYDVRHILISKKGEWEVPLPHVPAFADLAFIAMHGAYGEDGGVQRDLDSFQLPYTGSNATTSALAMNKFLTHRLLHHAGLRTPFSVLVSKHEWETDPDFVLRQIRYVLNFPIVVKPNADGSSVGVHITKDRDELVGGLQHVFSFSREALVQLFVSGRELTCGVVDHGIPGSEFALLPTEIVPQISGFFDYEAKYRPGGSVEITPARLPESYIREVQQTALRAHRLIEARGFSRTDFILSDDGKLYILEINTVPGLTEASLMPKAADASGIPFTQLLDIVIEAALRSELSK